MSRRFSITKFNNELFMAQQDHLHPENIVARKVMAAEYSRQQKLHDPALLPVLSQAALLMMTVSQVKNALIKRVLEDEQTRPAAVDFRALRLRGLAEYKPGKRQHDLTAQGIIAAKKLQQTLCQRFDIHILIEGARTTGPMQRFSCTCGKAYSVYRSTTASGNARAQWAREHATHDGITRLVAALKPPEKMEA